MSEMSTEAAQPQEKENPQAKTISDIVRSVSQDGLPDDMSEITALFCSVGPETVGKDLIEHPPKVVNPSPQLLTRFLDPNFIAEIEPVFTPIQPSEDDIALSELDFETMIPHRTQSQFSQPHETVAEIASYLSFPTRVDDLSDSERKLWRKLVAETLGKIDKRIGGVIFETAFRQQYKQNQLAATKINIITGFTEELAIDGYLSEKIIAKNEALKAIVVDQSELKTEGSTYSKMDTAGKLEIVEETRQLARDVVAHFVSKSA